MGKFLRWIVPFCMAFIFNPLVEAAVQQEETPVVAALLAEEQGVEAGRPFWVGVELKMAEGWDTYWMNPGDSGYPTKIDWQLPSGFTVEPVLWPAPERFTAQSLVAYGYRDEVLLMAKVTPPATLPAGEVTLSAHVTWLACKEQCVPGEADLTLTLPSVEAAEKGLHAATFEKWRSQLPRALEEGSFSHAMDAGELVLRFQAPQGLKEIETVLFIPDKAEVIDHGAPQNLHKEAQGFSLNLKPIPGKELPEQITGVLLISHSGEKSPQAIWVSTGGAAVEVVSSGSGGMSFSWTVVLAFLGGLILNVMPCVLPVISIKIMSFVKLAGQNRGLILKHGGAFTGGVLVSFWILAILLFALRAAGASVGWGFQLQEPIFVALLASVLFLLGLSLFGLFELGTSLIGVGQKGGGETPRSELSSSFMSGVLATLVATPCTGPLLGPALGFAMTLPLFSGLLIFTAMGLGMASPYLLLSAFPQLLRYLPKPGNWMVVFKQAMGFVMMLTVVWLLWVFGAQTDHFALLVLLISLLVLSVGAWIFGRWATPVKRKTVRLVATLCSLFILGLGAGGAIFAGKQYSEAPIAIEESAGEEWQTYTPERVAQLRAEGRPVFIDFTAKWCLICQANKALLHSSEISRLFKEKGVVTLTADWTRRDEVITHALSKLGRSGVPVYVFYPAGSGSEPILLPQTLTSAVVQSALSSVPSMTVHAD